MDEGNAPDIATGLRRVIQQREDSPRQPLLDGVEAFKISTPGNAQSPAISQQVIVFHLKLFRSLKSLVLQMRIRRRA